MANTYRVGTIVSCFLLAILSAAPRVSVDAANEDGKARGESERGKYTQESRSSSRLWGREHTRSNNSSSAAWRLNYPERTWCSLEGIKRERKRQKEREWEGHQRIAECRFSREPHSILSPSFSPKRSTSSVHLRMLVNSAIGHDVREREKNLSPPL